MTNDPQARQVDFSNHTLQRLADKLCRHFWGTTCHIPVVWNGRLTRSMGRFVYARSPKKRACQIEMSKHAARFIDRHIFVAVLLHELCHYKQFERGKPFQDLHPQFEQELRRVGAISTNSVQLPQRAYRLFCTKCDQYLGKRKRLNTKHYRSNCCRATIRKEETWIGTFQYDGRILRHSHVTFTDEP